MCTCARPPEEKAWRTAGNQMRFRKDLIEICALGRRGGRHILKKLAFYSGKFIFFSFIPLLSSQPHVHSFPLACDIVCWIEIGIRGQFSSSFLLQCPPYIEGVFLVGAEACTRGLCMGFLCWRNLLLWLVTERACNWGKDEILSSFIFKISFFLHYKKDKLTCF